MKKQNSNHFFDGLPPDEYTTRFSNEFLYVQYVPDHHLHSTLLLKEAPNICTPIYENHLRDIAAGNRDNLKSQRVLKL